MAQDGHSQAGGAAAYMTAEERTAAARAKLFAVHKSHGTLWIYYSLYPDEAAKTEPIVESERDHSRGR